MSIYSIDTIHLHDKTKPAMSLPIDNMCNFTLGTFCQQQQQKTEQKLFVILWRHTIKR